MLVVLNSDWRKLKRENVGTVIVIKTKFRLCRLEFPFPGTFKFPWIREILIYIFREIPGYRDFPKKY